MTEPMHLLSLGAGVQSVTEALMADAGEILYDGKPTKPECGIFSDTQCEPEEVYRTLAWLCGVEVKFKNSKTLGLIVPYVEPGIYKTGILSFPIHIITKGNLEDDFLEALLDPKSRCGQPPFYVWNADKQMEATLWRKCTKEYKLDEIRRETRRLCSREGRPVIQWIGISLDEAHRMKDSGVQYITNWYPLVEMRKSRHDCLMWLQRNGHPAVGKSACRQCPYINNARLREMRDNKTQDWTHLVAFDHEMRKRQRAVNNGAKITGTLFVHRSCQPIDQVDLSTEEDKGQGNLFGQECEGMCGV
jgi:hypothetical protein